MARGGALGKLNVLLGLDSTEFTRGLTKSEYEARQKLDRMAKEARKVGVAFAAVGAAAVAMGAGFAYVVKRQIDVMDGMAKSAQQAGTTTEALSSLGYAAELAGSNQDEMTSALVRLSRSMGDAEAGSKKTADAFSSLAISVINTDGSLRDSDKVFADIADRFSEMEDGARKTAIAQDLFGRSGAKLIPLLNSGKEGLEAARKEAEKLGIVIDNQAAKAAERFNDNLARLGKISQGWVNHIATEAIPILDVLLQQFTDTATEVGSVGDEVDETKKKQIAPWAKTSALALAGMADAVYNLGSSLSALSALVDGITSTPERIHGWATENISIPGLDLFKFTMSEEEYKKKLWDLTQTGYDAYNRAADARRRWDEARKGHSSAFTDNTLAAFEKLESEGYVPPTSRPKSDEDKPIKKTGGSDQGLAYIKQAHERIALIGAETEAERLLARVSTGAITFRTEAQQEFAIALARTQDAMLQAEKDASDFKTLMDGLYPEQAEIDRVIEGTRVLTVAFEEGTLSAEQYADAIDRLTSSGSENLLDMGEVAGLAFRGVGDAITDMMLTGEADFESFAKSIIASMARMMTQALIVGPIMKALGFAGGGGWTDSFASAFMGSYATGGFTGPGGKHEPAGIVHKGEYVLNQEATSRIGVPELDRLNRGYSSGGYVGARGPSGGNAGTSLTVNLIENKDKAGQVEQRRDESGNESADVFVADILGGGPRSKALQQVFGMRRQGA